LGILPNGPQLLLLARLEDGDTGRGNRVFNQGIIQVCKVTHAQASRIRTDGNDPFRPIAYVRYGSLHRERLGRSHRTSGAMLAGVATWSISFNAPQQLYTWLFQPLK
jgi:hypothetical protein